MLMDVGRGHADFRESDVSNFLELRQCELRRTPQSGSWGTAPRGTITPPIDQEEETKDRGFLEEALARPGG